MPPWQESGAESGLLRLAELRGGAPGVEPYVPPAYEESDPVAAFLRACPWPIHAALVRRRSSMPSAVSLRSCFSSMDYDLWLRILGQTRHMVRVPEVMAFYRWHSSGQVSSVKWRQVLDALAAQKCFIRDHQALVSHLAPERIEELTEGQVLRQAYRAVWHRDVASAHRLFRHVGQARAFRSRDVGHVAAAMLPISVYRRLVNLRDQART